MRSTIRRKAKDVSLDGYKWFHDKVVPRFPPSAVSWIVHFEQTVVSVFNAYWRYRMMPDSRKLILVVVLFSTGTSGFCVSPQLPSPPPLRV